MLMVQASQIGEMKDEPPVMWISPERIRMDVERRLRERIRTDTEEGLTEIRSMEEKKIDRSQKKRTSSPRRGTSDEHRSPRKARTVQQGTRRQEKRMPRDRQEDSREWQQASPEQAKPKQASRRREDIREVRRDKQAERKVPRAALEVCPYARKCGGCDIIEMPYDKQLKLKQERIEKLLAPVAKAQAGQGSGKPAGKNAGKPAGNNAGFTIEKIVGADNPFYYRNKVHSVFTCDRAYHILRGIYEKNSHRVIDIKECKIEDQKANEIIEEIRKLLPSFKLTVYNEDTGRGFLRHVLVRVASQGIMVVLVTGEVMFPGKKNFVMALRKKFPEITTVVQNINDKQTSMVLGTRNVVLYGPGYVVDDRLGLRFRISPDAFYQINSPQTVKLYKLAREMATCELTGKTQAKGGSEHAKDACKSKIAPHLVWDLYCGTGTIGMFMAGSAEQVVGVELNREAVKDAKNNARENGIQNIRFVNMDATEYMQRALADIKRRKNGVEAGSDAEVIEAPDVLMMDPPRSGSTPEFINAVAELKIPRVVYVSCGPDTLARDLLLFQKKGYMVQRVVPVDMFPNTGHVETVCLLSKKP
jgi:23S rRNA (uracil1939-C5)-methyltransferase